MKSAEHDVSRKGRPNGNLCRFPIADLTDDENVRILAQQGPQPVLKDHAALGLHLALRQAVNQISTGSSKVAILRDSS